MDQHLYLYQHLGVKVPPLPVCFLLAYSTALFGAEALLEAFKISQKTQPYSPQSLLSHLSVLFSWCLYSKQKYSMAEINIKKKNVYNDDGDNGQRQFAAWLYNQLVWLSIDLIARFTQLEIDSTTIFLNISLLISLLLLDIDIKELLITFN